MKKRLQLQEVEKSSPVLIVGSVAYDDIVTPEMSEEGLLGGAAAFGAVAASYFTDVRLSGVVGSDFKQKDFDRLLSHGIDLSGLEKKEGEKTFYWKGEYFEDFNDRRTVELQLNVFEKFKPQLSDVYRDTSYVFLANIDPEIQHSVLKQVNEKSYVLIDTIDFWIETKRDELLALLKEVDMFTLNLDEASLLTGEHNPIKAGQLVRELGPETVILKKGSHGAYLFHKEGLFMLPAYPVTELHDPTGAGDVFAGALMGYLAAVHDHSFSALKRAMVYSTAVASLAVEAFSCDQVEAAGYEGIQKRYDELVKFISL